MRFNKTAALTKSFIGYEKKKAHSSSRNLPAPPFKGREKRADVVSPMEGALSVVSEEGSEMLATLWEG